MATLSRRNLMRSAAAGAVGLAGAGRYRTAMAQQSQPIKLPIMFSLSGPLATVGNPARMGAELTARMINQNGGFMGRTVELQFFDDKGTANDLIAAGREIVSSGYNYLAGGLISSHFPGLVPLITETKSVYLCGTGSSPALTNEWYSRYMFPGTENDLQRGNVLAQLAADKFPDIKRFGCVVSQAQSYIESYKNYQIFCAKYYGKSGKVPAFDQEQVTKFGTTDFRTVLSQLAASDADAFYNFVVGADGLTFWKQARAFNLGNKFKAVIDQTIDFMVLKILKQDMPPNLWGLMAWYHGLHTNDNEMAREFYKAYVAQTNDTLPSGYVQYGNTAVVSMLGAMKQAGGKTDTESLINAFETVQVTTIKGDQYWRKEDHLLICDSDICNIVPTDDSVGAKVVNAIRYNLKDLSPAPNPGKPYKVT